MVAIEKVALVRPAGILILVGGRERVNVVVQITLSPPAGAGPLRVTVPVHGVPPVTVEGSTATETTAKGMTLRAVDRLVDP